MISIVKSQASPVGGGFGGGPLGGVVEGLLSAIVPVASVIHRKCQTLV